MGSIWGHSEVRWPTLSAVAEAASYLACAAAVAAVADPSSVVSTTILSVECWYDVRAASLQGLTLVPISAQVEPRLIQEITLHTLNTP